MSISEKVLNVEELKSRNIVKALVAEFIGNLLLNFFGCISTVVIAGPPFFDVVTKALTFGFSVFIIVMIIGHISGGHINPAVTIGMLTAGKISLPKALLYIIVQCLGAIAGSAIVYGVIPESYRHGAGVTSISDLITAGQGFGIEFFLGFVLVLTVFGVCDPNKPELKSTAALSIGLAVAVGHLAAIDITGSSMNPARSFGAAVVSNEWKHHWVYWIGPILGGIVASLIYNFILAAPSLGPLKIIERYTTVVTDDKERSQNKA